MKLLHRYVLAALCAAPMMLSANAFADEAPVAEAAPAAEAAKAPASPWTVTTNINMTSDYYSRGASQSWHEPALQGGFDVSHSSGFYAGVWSSMVSERTYVGTFMEFDVYGGYTGTIPAVEGLGYSLGVAGYIYPGGSWSKYSALTTVSGTPVNKDFNTWEANVGLSYKWISGKVSYTLTDWYGASKETGWSKSSDGSMYYELNALVPLNVWGLSLIGHVGHSDIEGGVSTDPLYAPANGTTIVQTSADMTDWKFGLTKSFDIAGSTGYSATVVYVGGTNGGNNGYWGKNGYGGSSFTTTPGSKDLTDSRLVFTLGRTF